MSIRHPMELISPYDVLYRADPFPFDMYAAKCLAQGDSWFSIGALPPTATTNILRQLRLAKSVVTVNCARPGKVLAHMTDTTSDPLFVSLLTSKLNYTWDAILISGGGNDLIDAAAVGPNAKASERLLATPAERGHATAPADYLSPSGWTTFAKHLGEVFDNLLDLRDRGGNRSTPLILHNYSRLMPRVAGAGLGFGPWLAPSLTAFKVPPTEWLAVASTLLAQLDALLRDLIARREASHPGSQLHLIDSQTLTSLDLAQPGSSGASGDFVNEIHPTRDGYSKLARAWEPLLDALL